DYYCLIWHNNVLF
nr:immunoglobulin light chain junction region [Macaca mulatta]